MLLPQIFVLIRSTSRLRRKLRLATQGSVTRIISAGPSRKRFASESVMKAENSFELGLRARSDTNRMQYTGCNTRIISLKALPQIPVAKNTPDSEYRRIYHEYLESFRRRPDRDNEPKELSVKAAKRQERKEQSKFENARQLSCAVTSLTSGIAPPVAFPTETVYGLGADATNHGSIAGIFAAKGRPGDNPLIVHVSSIEHLERCLGGTGNESAIPEVYQDLIKEFWPGPLTILIPVPEAGKGVKFASNVHPGQNTIGFRIPKSPYARFLIAIVDRPIAAPSANSSGKPSPTVADHVKDDLDGKINFILDGGNCDVGVESTVVDGLGETPLILRPGGVSKFDIRMWGKKMNNNWQHIENGWEHKSGAKRKREEIQSTTNLSKKTPKLENAATEIETADMFESPATQSPAGDHSDLHLEQDSSKAPRAPGMKYKHYAPSGKLFLFEPQHGASRDTSMRAVYRKLGELLKARDVSPTRMLHNVANDGKAKRGSGPVIQLARLQVPSHELNIAVLTSTSWPRLAALPDRWNELYPEWYSENAFEEIGDSLDTYELNVEHGPEGLPRRCVRVHGFKLGVDPASVARNLFASLRMCDHMKCEWIFAEAPVQSPENNGTSEDNEDVGLTWDANAFETVLERMRKAASEVIPV